MSPPRDVLLYDTTLRDGTQREGLCFSLGDKLRVARVLDEFGVDDICRAQARAVAATAPEPVQRERGES